MITMHCQYCGFDSPDGAKFCTKCGKPLACIESAYRRCNTCCHLNTIAAKFCVACGCSLNMETANVSHSFSSNKCFCGADLKMGAKFCVKCGSKIEPELHGKEITQLCSCGSAFKSNAKFCVVCGAMRPPSNIIMQEHKGSRKKSFLSQWRILAAIFCLFAIIAGLYFTFLYKPGIKKNLLAVYEVLPNDTSETIIQYNDELSIIIPVGQIKTKDTLNLYSVENIDKPEFADDVLRTYDFEFKETHSFNEQVEVVFSYKNDLAQNDIELEQSVYIMYYNEASEQWENTDAIINKTNNTIRVFRSHFSCLGLITHTSKPGPMMQALGMIDPATINYPSGFDDAEKTLASFIRDKKPSEKANGEGIDLFMKAYEITTLSTGVHEDVFKYPLFNKFNKLAGNLGLLKATVAFGIELGKGNYLDAIKSYSKELIMFKLGTMGWQFVAIYNVASFLYDLYQEQMESESAEAIEQQYRNDYYHYNATKNPYRKSSAEWTSYISNNIDKLIDFEWQLNQEVEQYLLAYFNERRDVPDNIRQALIKMERARMKNVIKEAVDRYLKDLRQRQEMDVIQTLSDMKMLMNTVITINVCVYGKEEGSKAVRGLPVKIVVAKDQELWQGETDRAGQFVFNCTWLGFYYYGAPSEVEVEYEGNVYKGKIAIDNSNMAIVRIYLNESNSSDQMHEPDNDIADNSNSEPTEQELNFKNGFPKQLKGVYYFEKDTQYTSVLSYGNATYIERLNLELTVDASGAYTAKGEAYTQWEDSYSESSEKISTVFSGHGQFNIDCYHGISSTCYCRATLDFSGSQHSIKLDYSGVVYDKVESCKTAVTDQLSFEEDGYIYGELFGHQIYRMQRRH